MPGGVESVLGTACTELPIEVADSPASGVRPGLQEMQEAATTTVAQRCVPVEITVVA